MKKQFSTLFFVLLQLQLWAQIPPLPKGYPATDRQKTKINQGWKFHLGDPDAKFYSKNFNDKSWEEVNIPHTLKLTSINLDGCKDDKTQPTFHREVGWYRKSIKVGKNKSKKVFLEFEGAHQVTDLWINGVHVGQHSLGGYTPFLFDISKYVKYGANNQVTLLVDNRKRNDIPPDPGSFDYVKFSGLYRDVYLVETNSMRITYNIEGFEAGVTITTPSVDPVNLNTTINIKTTVKNESNKSRTAIVLNRVIDKKGEVVLKLIQEAKIAPNSTHTFNQIGGIEENLRLWSTEDPYLYKVNTLVLENGKPIDCVDNPLGVRKFELDPEKGFKLNGKVIELIGFNRHQHYGYIGDAMPDALHYKDMLQFKQLGFNVMRAAHYPQDDAIMKACDELGILVYEEAPTWIGISQNPKWYNKLEEAARVMVRNHRNHPSVVIWGAGINHRGYVPQIHYAVKQEDPVRLTASQSSRWTGWQTSGLTDIFANMNYGPVVWERNEPLFAMEGRYGPDVIAQYKRDPMMPGMISWTAHAYYTFHDIGNWEDRTRSGMLTSFRSLKRPILMWYPSELTTEPMIYINGKWTAQTKQLQIFSNCEKLELLVNNKSIGMFRPSKALKFQGLDHPPYEIDIKQFEEGKLTVNGFIGGKIAVKESIYTPEEAVAVKLVLDTEGRQFTADGSDIMVGYAQLVDKNGMVIQTTDKKITFEVEGDAIVVGDKENIGSNPAPVSYGTAAVLIRAGLKAGKVKVRAKVKGLKSDEVTVTTVADQNNMIAKSAYPIIDKNVVKIDMGKEGQLTQFGWQHWNGQDNQSSTQSFHQLGGFTASIKASSDNGVLRWLGEMNVIGKFAFAYGEGVIGIDKKGIVLELEGLKSGKYSIKTYHHAPSSNTDSMDPNLEKLKKLTIHKLPYASTLSITITDASGTREVKNIGVSEGKDVQFSAPGTEEISFTADGSSTVRLILKSQNDDKGVWLNAFELTQFIESNSGKKDL